MKAPSAAVVIACVLSISALAAAEAGAYLGAVAALVGLTALFSIRVLGGKMELRAWLRPAYPRTKARVGPLQWARTEVRGAARGNRYFRSQVADAIVRAEAAKAGRPNPSRGELEEARAALLSSSDDQGLRDVLSPGGAPLLRGDAYLSKLTVAMEMVEND